jgi:hypothetical protein
VRARAVAIAGQAGDGCVVAFNEVELGSVGITGSVDVNLVGCTLAANSSHPQAMMMNGNATLNALAVNLVGGYTLNGNPTLNTDQGVRTRQSPIGDPYENVPTPSYSGCNYNNHVVNGGTVNFSANGSPTVFCNGLAINGGTVNFAPGIYVIDRQNFTVNGNATINAPGVTFVLTSSTGTDYATATINGTANMNATAPTSGPTAGMLFFQDRRAPGGGVNTINGTSSTNMRGALYFPGQEVRYNGNNTSLGGCTQLLADKVRFNGNATFGINCQGAGVRAIGGFATALVE